MNTLVIAEHDNNQFKSSTLSTLSAAKQLGNEINLLVAGNGHNFENLIFQASQIEGVSKVLKLNNDNFSNAIAEHYSALVLSIASGYTHIIAPATSFGKDFMPRVAAKLDTQQISDITEVVSNDTFVRLIYAGNAVLKIQSTDSIKCITVRPTSFEACSTSGNNASIEEITCPELSNYIQFVSTDNKVSDRPELTTAKIVVSGGRGVGSKENFDMIFNLADKIGAAVGASRAAVDAGYIENTYQVGQTGKVVVPDLYIAIGISGAIQHLAGMKESKIVVAINSDAEAPIFNFADYGLCGDLFELIPQLMNALD